MLECVRFRVKELTCLKRVTVHRVIPGKYPADSRSGIRTTVFGEKRRFHIFSNIRSRILILRSAYFDPKSESRQQRLDRLAKEKENGVRVEVDKGVNGTAT
jgi:hypothetical protein